MRFFTLALAVLLSLTLIGCGGGSGGGGDSTPPTVDPGDGGTDPGNQGDNGGIPANPGVDADGFVIAIESDINHETDSFVSAFLQADDVYYIVNGSDVTKVDWTHTLVKLTDGSYAIHVPNYNPGDAEDLSDVVVSFYGYGVGTPGYGGTDTSKTPTVSFNIRYDGTTAWYYIPDMSDILDYENRYDQETWSIEEDGIIIFTDPLEVAANG